MGSTLTVSPQALQVCESYADAEPVVRRWTEPRSRGQTVSSRPCGRSQVGRRMRQRASVIVDRPAPQDDPATTSGRDARDDHEVYRRETT